MDAQKCQKCDTPLYAVWVSGLNAEPIIKLVCPVCPKPKAKQPIPLGATAFPKTAIDAQVRNVPTKISVAVKNERSMLFWYMIQRPCPVCEAGAHWEMFDVRWFGVKDKEWIAKYQGQPDKALRAVKKLIRRKDVFREISERVGIGAVDFIAPTGQPPTPTP